MTFYISPLIKITLLSLYIALTVPLPFLAQLNTTTIPSGLLWIGIGFGGIILYAALSEQVVLDDEKIQVCYPFWVPDLLHKGWSLSWSEITALKPRTTGQGGLVYYFLSRLSERAYLLPVRVAGFAKLVREVEAKTGIDTTDVRPLAQPWMYLILLAFTLLLLVIDAWTIATAVSL
ncbi:hypothetical protein [Roseofilum casamattae]|uniref:Uncharacterized protein n=1 Tax=Roseofilum casamattae BLCC-M143 TaxID=3022442 RepID=A0ABT7BR51_9CYAN|nr:hypothetical protein [Roseofilum casamattae]MDJ1181682.1 hypothetical protein [Roseofilum casamattae BLCC-M143]